MTISKTKPFDKELAKYSSLQRKIFFSKADINRPNLIPIKNIKLKIIKEIFNFYFGNIPDYIKKIPHTTFHLAYKASLKNKIYLIKFNSINRNYKELNIITNYFLNALFKKHKLPYYKTYIADTSRKLTDTDFEIRNYLKGKSLFDLSHSRKNLNRYIKKTGTLLKKLHKIKCGGFGQPNLKILFKINKLIGIHKSWFKFLSLNLDRQLNICLKHKIINKKQKLDILNIFINNKNLLKINQSSLLNGDVANHNIIVSGTKCTFIDWEDCIIGDPVYDLAYYISGIYENENWVNSFLQGYGNILTNKHNLNRFNIYFLRISIAKAVSRINLSSQKKAGLPDIEKRIQYSLSKFS